MHKYLISLFMSFIASSCGVNKSGISMLEDAFESYNFAKQYGDQSDICVAAGVVTLEYLDLRDKLNYKRWKKIQNEECDYLYDP